MIWAGLNDADVLELVEVCNAPIHEISQGLVSLSSAQINVSKSINRVVLAEGWHQ